MRFTARFGFLIKLRLFFELTVTRWPTKDAWQKRGKSLTGIGLKNGAWI